MSERCVRLSGEHPTLPAAELGALLAVHDPRASTRLAAPTLAIVAPGDEAAVDAALSRMALAHGWARLVATGSLDDVVEAVRRQGDGMGAVAVRAERAGTERKVSRTDAERRIGAALHEAGHKIDLGHPDRTFVAWIDGATVVVGERLGEAARGRYETRRVTGRAHFSPVTLHPRRAATLVHLARVPPGGTVYDPFCGTGGILLEAALDGYQVVGSDRDPWMVQGTYQALADEGPEALDGIVFEADIGDTPDLVGPVDAIATDLPYGQASGTDLEDVAALSRRAFAAFAAILAKDARAVFGIRDAAVAKEIADAGFAVEEHHAEFVHRSLTRHYVVARRTGPP